MPVSFSSNGLLLSTTWANKPASYPVGQPIFITDAGTKGSHWFYDGARWKPVNGVALLASKDSASSSINNSATIVFQYQMPAGLWQAGDRLRVGMSITKSGTTDTGGIVCRIGTAGTTSDTAIFSLNPMAAATLQAAYLFDIRLESATSAQMLASTRAPMGYGQTSSVALDAAVTISSATSNALWVNIAINSSGTTNTVQLLDANLQLFSKGN